mmetsp:Transcript_44044/g.82346  ORF Transcript_44044/g.82346 Transcript_44044/m.82346 type:complete len:426 (-) Transcript_44044:126-1403(-)
MEEPSLLDLEDVYKPFEDPNVKSVEKTALAETPPEDVYKPFDDPSVKPVEDAAGAEASLDDIYKLLEDSNVKPVQTGAPTGSLLDDDPVVPSVQSAAPPPPPPPPPPPAEDLLEDVYRPFEDPNVKTGEEASQPEAPLDDFQRLMEDLATVKPVDEGAAAEAPLEDVYRPFDDPNMKSGKDAQRLEAQHVVDLSQTPAPAAPLPAAPAAPVADARRSRDPNAMNRIPVNATGFGSDDLFGRPATQESAFDAVYNLPEKVRQHVLSDCMGVPPAQAEEVVLEQPRSEEAIREEVMNTNLEGRWVPTYMRQQLVAGGHTALPAAPNAHEFSAAAPPPSLGQTFLDMGQDLGDGAQAVLEFMAGFFTSLSFQCQACTHATVSTAHEQVMVVGDWCTGEDDLQGDFSSQMNFGPPVHGPEAPSAQVQSA